MKILSWNVNGIRAVIKKGFLDFLKKEKPDVLCLQETKIDTQSIKDEMFDFPGYVEYYNSAERKGYSGTAILVREKQLSSEASELSCFAGNGFGKKEFDCEGRVQTLEFDKFYLVNAYFPNANHELTRLDYKVRFDRAMLKYLKKLEKVKPIIICGDFNVAHKEIDLARPKNNVGSAGFTSEERQEMSKYLNSGLVDTFRYFYPDKQAFSWWSYRARARERDVGWRIDYFLVSAKIMARVKKAFILNKIYGSDHCPVGIEIH